MRKKQPKAKKKKNARKTSINRSNKKRILPKQKQPPTDNNLPVDNTPMVDQQLNNLNDVQLKAHLLYRDDFNKLTRYASLPVYIYGTYVRTLAPEFYKVTTDTIEAVTNKLHIPYDATIQNHHLGSFAGALFLTTLSRDIFFGSQSKKDNTGKDTNIIASDEYATYYNFEKSGTRKGIVAIAAGLTCWEAKQAFQPNRSFDYGDMTAYGLAITLYAIGTKMAARKAIKRFENLSSTEVKKALTM